ncbi:KpsF/GutQ family sugar-phosphate isomerase [Moraxella catarrhalis]|jgi:sugar isomerase, kpsF/gutQ family|uniref:KpsF/GutQ family sugar-phosphate isomerase n=2 Tax=Moraxella catarrhalis TaxID=480 RepID=UPI0002029DA8|nr:KpsF/GutQ family sugar-phosphate isomerase [Moraxella catarrhalis]ARB67716.1 KpsF/GutQ family sugar-phosphate isomerase [Moraxella catarrhalis]EGE10511.1 arabinose 5-phosphate isomerase [Moraxella catarrhalis 46P47B1]EGE15583.1 arabinose 5-phosphate isomerase [Moraxella catarrhalis 103P14B1]EGE23362.1 arabinose 5-phosphate isomerase [Moraxella catarrhalis 101P30B1]EGE25632.1 arabinose 5-phosphate isomerase [Moraxella catarrhalis CO72]
MLLLWPVFLMNEMAMKQNNLAPSDYIQDAIDAIRTEQRALELLIDELDERFVNACQTILNCSGRVVVTGMGKSGHIGRKIAATFASTGTPAFFMHPGEAGHGDLGMLVQGDVLIAISNSGESDEIRMLLPVVKQLNIPLISISRDKRGILPRSADIALTLGLSEEACPLGLAPTSSTTATLALGDALAVALLHARGFTSHDFALSHPAGALGRRLLTRVSDIMHTDHLPVVHHQSSLNETLLVMTSGRLGLAVVVDDDGKVVGIFTDGDLRRKLAEHTNLTVEIQTLMTKTPKSVDQQMRASDALSLMNENAISQLLVLKDRQLIGVISIHDILKAGIS